MSQAIQWEYDGGAMNIGYSFDEADGLMRVHYHQPIDRIVAENRHRRLHEDNSAQRRSGKLYEIANIPMSIIAHWRNVLGVDINNPDDFPKILQLVQSPEWCDAVMVCQGSFKAKPRVEYFTGARDRAPHPLASNRARIGGAIGRGIK